MKYLLICSAALLTSGLTLFSGFVLADGVEDRRATLFLQDVPLREALEILLEIKGLDCRAVRPEGSFLIGPLSARE